MIMVLISVSPSSPLASPVNSLVETCLYVPKIVVSPAGVFSALSLGAVLSALPGDMPIYVGGHSKGGNLAEFAALTIDEGGYARPFTGPGLGIDVNEELIVERSREAPDWRNPVWRHADGAVAEW